jgi:hypothetical protein
MGGMGSQGNTTNGCRRCSRMIFRMAPFSWPGRYEVRNGRNSATLRYSCLLSLSTSENRRSQIEIQSLSSGLNCCKNPAASRCVDSRIHQANKSIDRIWLFFFFALGRNTEKLDVRAEFQKHVPSEWVVRFLTTDLEPRRLGTAKVDVLQSWIIKHATLIISS